MPLFTKFVSSGELLVDAPNSNLTLAGLAHVFVRTGGYEPPILWTLM